VVDEGRHVVKQYRFEIFRQTRRRFSWRFVADDKGRRRVLARSARDYRSPEKARKAIIALRNTSAVVTIDGDPFELPETSFEVLTGTVPLIVDPSAVEVDDDVSPLVVETLPPVVQQAVVEPATPVVTPEVVEPATPVVTPEVVEPKAPRGSAGAAAKPRPPAGGAGRGRRAT
jgi:uncharacterized protein YegP (UPF0339 family)